MKNAEAKRKSRPMRGKMLK